MDVVMLVIEVVMLVMEEITLKGELGMLEVQGGPGGVALVMLARISKRDSFSQFFRS